jgi:putative transposase
MPALPKTRQNKFDSLLALKEHRGKARQVLGKRHLKISRKRQDHAVKLARSLSVNPN